jgi:metal-sulfur cluster biosynthetic enzyme
MEDKKEIKMKEKIKRILKKMISYLKQVIDEEMAIMDMFYCSLSRDFNK